MPATSRCSKTAAPSRFPSTPAALPGSATTRAGIPIAMHSYSLAGVCSSCSWASTTASRDREQELQTPAKLNECIAMRSEEHTSELQSLAYLVCRLLLEKK